MMAPCRFLMRQVELQTYDAWQHMATSWLSVFQAASPFRPDALNRIFYMWNSNFWSMRPVYQNESKRVVVFEPRHSFKSMPRIEAPAAKLRSPNDLNVKKWAVTADIHIHKGQRSNRCSGCFVMCFLFFFFGSESLQGSLASGRWRHGPWIRWARATQCGW